MSFGSPEGIANTLPKGNAGGRIDMINAIGEHPWGKLEGDIRPSAHVLFVVLTFGKGRKKERLSCPRPSGKEDGGSSVCALCPRGGDGRKRALLFVLMAPPGIADFPGAEGNVKFLRLLEYVPKVKVSLNVDKEAHTNGVRFEWVVQEWLNTNVRLQLG